MKQSSRLELTPNLRFPEFRDAGTWAKLPLSSVLDYERPEKYIVSDTNYTNSGTPVLTANKSFVLGHTHETVGIYTSIPVIIFDDFTTDKKYVDFPFKVKSSAIKILKNKGANSLKVIFEAMGSLIFDPKEHKRYYISEYQNLQIALPKPPEQRKIADCLSSLDDVIAAYARKVDALKAHKAGLMQQLFPQDGETLPRLRFPEFRDARDWASIPLGELLSRKPEYGVNAAAVSFSEDLPTYLRITDISEDGNFIRGTKASVDIDAADEHYLIDGDIVLARTGASTGKSYRYRKEDGRLVFAGFLIRVRPNPKKLNPTFLSNFLSTVQYWDWVRITSTRSGQPGINGSEYATLPVPIPPNDVAGDGLSEQQRIADCLSSVDEQIATETRKLKTLKIHKSGLMQQLFPLPAEVGA